MNTPTPPVHPRPTLLRLLTMLFFVGAVTVPDASALVTRDAVELDEKVLPPAPFRQSPRLIIAGEGGPAAAAAAAFRSRRGGKWTIRFDERTGRPALISGSGIPLLPGRGNSLTPALLGLPSASFDLADAEPLARAFIEAEGDLLLPDVGDLRLNPARSGSFDGGRIHYFDYDWYVDGIPVEGARVFLRVNHGNIVQFGTDGVGRRVVQLHQCGDQLQPLSFDAVRVHPRTRDVDRFRARPAGVPRHAAGAGRHLLLRRPRLRLPLG